MSLLKRTSTNALNTQPQSRSANRGLGNRQQNNQGNNQQNSPFSRSSRGSSPFGSRNNQSQSQNHHLANVVIPVRSTLVRFSLDGMGDPFYRLLGHDMNPEFAKVEALAEALQKGGDDVKALIEALDKAWEGYNLKGAMLVFNEDREVATALLKPSPMPAMPQKKKDDDDDDDENDTPDWLESANYSIERLRAIDLTLTLNVLARGRSQVIVARAPAVFGVEYLTRSLITDDPRLVQLAKATGCLPDS